MIKQLIATSVLLLLVFCSAISSAQTIVCWFQPEWEESGQARDIAKALSLISGLNIQPRIATSYVEILSSFETNERALFYGGSFVQSILSARELGEPLVQAINGRELYSGVCIHGRGVDPVATLEQAPEKVAYALGASSGEASAKAATKGKASIGLPNHGAVAAAVDLGQAEAGFVKNWWWEDNKNKYPQLEATNIEGVSQRKHVDFVLTASSSVPKQARQKIAQAAEAGKAAFGAMQFVRFYEKNLEFSKRIMMQAGIDPWTYAWR